MTKTITLGGKEYALSPLNAGHLEDFPEEIKRLMALRDTPVGEDAKALVTLIHASLVLKHPEVSREELRQLLDFRTLMQALPILMGASGFVPASSGEVGPQS